MTQGLGQFRRLGLSLRVAVLAITFGGLSSNYGQTLTLTSAPQAGWGSIAISADGNFIIACEPNIFTSTNGGSTWVSNNLSVGSVAIAPDGDAVAIDGGTIYLSTNFGTTWATNALNIPNPGEALITANGTLVLYGGGVLCTSTNLGATGTEYSYPNSDFLACSGDATKLIACDYTLESIYRSTNSGNSWYLCLGAPDQHFIWLISSGNGMQLAAGYDGALYSSQDSGLLWDMFSWPIGGNFAVGCAISLDGSRLIAVGGVAAFHIADPPYAFYISDDSGETWSSNTISTAQGYFRSALVCCSPDGIHSAFVLGGMIYTIYCPPSLRIHAFCNTLALSWPAPSSGFVLQQSSDVVTGCWTNVAITPTVIDYENRVMITHSSGYTFYRLAAVQ